MRPSLSGSIGLFLTLFKFICTWFGTDGKNTSWKWLRILNVLIILIHFQKLLPVPYLAKKVNIHIQFIQVTSRTDV